MREGRSRETSAMVGAEVWEDIGGGKVGGRGAD